jgi:hydroxyacylglutathione hydrolase
MFFEQLIRQETGCATYVIGGGTGEAVVVDPLWDVEPVLAKAKQYGVRITHIIDTHSHADHVSGARRLAHRTGATLYLSLKADVVYPCERLKGGDILTLGEVRVTVLDTPGHRPEHISLAVADTSRAEEAWYVLTGDSLYVGDVARPDLAHIGEVGASALYDSVYHQLMGLPDYVEVYPGHGAGST